MYAFWKYDLFPGFLGSKASDFVTENDREYAKIPSYGNAKFQVTFKMNDVDGEILKNDLEELSEQYRVDSELLRQTYLCRRDRLLHRNNIVFQ